jgi:hypothetical protein
MKEAANCGGALLLVVLFLLLAYQLVEPVSVVGSFVSVNSLRDCINRRSISSLQPETDIMERAITRPP